MSVLTALLMFIDREWTWAVLTIQVLYVESIYSTQNFSLYQYRSLPVLQKCSKQHWFWSQLVFCSNKLHKSGQLNSVRLLAYVFGSKSKGTANDAVGQKSFSDLALLGGSNINLYKLSYARQNVTWYFMRLPISQLMKQPHGCLLFKEMVIEN